MHQTICQPQACALCMACVNICPTGAISICEDINGYEAVTINQEACIGCGMCTNVCQRREKVNRNLPLDCYAAQAKSVSALENSASGGAFQMLAQIVLESGGICYGCAMSHTEQGYCANHTRVESMEQLGKILNSKYIPSMIMDSYQLAKNDLNSGRLVLFSGTPCQIQGLLAFLNKQYSNLLTADLICHGITATKLFNDYIKHVEQRDDITIVDYVFRDKSVSWGTNFSYAYYRNRDPQKRVKVKHCPREASSYMINYLRGNIFRENCYQCSLSCSSRVSDFTLGDYWQIEMEHPEFVLNSKPAMSLRKGISCILVNTQKAKSRIPQLEEKMILHPVELESIRTHNGNLCKPSKRGKQRDQFLKMYSESGYAPIEQTYRNSVGKKMLVFQLKNSLKSRLPDCLRIWIYRNKLLRKLVFHS